VLAILQFHADVFVRFALFDCSSLPLQILTFGIYSRLRLSPIAPKSVSQGRAYKKCPAPIPATCGNTERRARFSYDDLPELFSFYGVPRNIRIVA
jgi:hypothetical protein